MNAPAGTRITPGLAGAPSEVDVVVIGLGVTGCGVALDAVSRGLSVLAVDAHDLAFGTSRWSSKLVHGGLRYLANGQFGVAHESAVERGVLMEVTAPHLTHAMAYVVPYTASSGLAQRTLTRLGLRAGDALRRGAGTSPDTLPGPRKLSATEILQMAPCLRTDGLKGGLVSWDGQLEDDARLVTTIARTAAAFGAHVRTRARVVRATGREVVLRDEITGAEHVVATRATVNAAGVWAGELVDDITLRPSRGTHLVLRADTLPGLSAAVFAPVPGSLNRFVMVLPQADGTHYVGLTDEPVEGEIPDVPEPSEAEIGFLLDVVSAAFDAPLRRSDVVGAFAGLRPLLDGGDGSTADLSRRHAVLTSGTGVVTIVGGKLTTYRKMAEDAVDAVVEQCGLVAEPCTTASLPLLGAAPRAELAALELPRRLVRRYGTDAALVLENARAVTGLGDDELLAPVSDRVPVTLAELVFGITHEGAHDADDLLDRRTRIGLVPEDRAAALPVAERALSLARPASVLPGTLDDGGSSSTMTTLIDEGDTVTELDSDTTATSELADFDTLTASYQRELLAHCYRMSGSVHEAEDLVQETFLRAWKASATFQGRSSVRTWLYRIATNVCLTNLENKPKRPLPAGLGTADQMAGDALEENHEITWLEPVPDAAVVVAERDSIRLAFVAALQHLPARQRAVLILRDVLRWSAAETADALDTTVAAVNSALQRAHAQLADRGLDQDSMSAAGEELTEQQKAFLDRYVEAFWRKDIDTIVAMLKADAVWEMPPFTNWYKGSTTIGELIGTKCPGGVHDMPMIATVANGQPAFGLYMRTPEGHFEPFHLQVLTLEGDRVAHVGAFFDHRLFDTFGLPARLPADYEPGLTSR